MKPWTNNVGRAFSGLAVLVCASVLLLGCGGRTTSKVDDGEIDKTIDQEAVTKKYFESIGIGAADPSITNTTQRMATSRNAAIVAAQFEMLTMIKGARVSGGITVEKAIETDSRIQSELDAEIKGGEIVKTEWTKDDGCIVTIQLDKTRLEKIMNVRFE